MLRISILLSALAAPALCVFALRWLAVHWRPRAALKGEEAESSPRRVAIALDVSSLGSSTLTTFFTALFAVALLLHAQWLEALVYALAVILAGGSATWLKLASAHERLQGARTLTFGSSFPSTHTTLSTVCYGGALLTAWPMLHEAPSRTWIVLAALLTVGAVAVSRVWLGAHRRRDVLAGLALGLSFLLPVAVSSQWPG